MRSVSRPETGARGPFNAWALVGGTLQHPAACFLRVAAPVLQACGSVCDVHIFAEEACRRLTGVLFGTNGFAGMFKAAVGQHGIPGDLHDSVCFSPNADKSPNHASPAQWAHWLSACALRMLVPGRCACSTACI